VFIKLARGMQSCQLPNFGNFIPNSQAMGKNTSVSLGDHFQDFVESSISEGRYNNASEVIRAGLRLLEEEEHKITALKAAIREGIASGIANDFKPEKHLELLKAGKKGNG
jgi:antitoxin ParD1/3/4